jgi:hypothetical protein
MRTLINRTSLSFASAAVVCLFAGSSPAADAVNYTDLFRTRAIKCIHPTVNPEKATVETVKEPDNQRRYHDCPCEGFLPRFI